MIKSQQRITDFGEVYTSEREVNAMLDLVKEETQRIESRFLEPACGNGNFLIEVLKRKLHQVSARYSRSQYDYEKYCIVAASSIYGIDILEDNVSECISRLSQYIFDEHLRVTKKEDAKFKKVIRFILSRNIIVGDATSLKIPNSETPIIFSEWNFIGVGKVKRTDYTLSNLIAYQPFEGDSLFSDLGEEAFIPQPIKSYDVCNIGDICDD